MSFDISLPHALVLVSAFISVIGSSAYVRDTLAGTTTPNRVSWSLWALAPLLATLAAISAGADVWATARIFLAGFLPLIIFITSFFNTQGYWRITTFDIWCCAFSLFGILMWLTAGSPQLAILFLAIADGFASFPTIIKAWRFPDTETGFTYVMGLIAVLLVLPSIPVWNIENSAFQIYLILANIALLVSVYRKRFFALNNQRGDGFA